MKFVANLSYISGHLRSGSLVGTLPDDVNPKNMTTAELHELLHEFGTVHIDDYVFNEIGPIDNITWGEK